MPRWLMWMVESIDKRGKSTFLSFDSEYNAFDHATRAAETGLTCLVWQL
jgi:hypothetical protein